MRCVGLNWLLVIENIHGLEYSVGHNVYRNNFDNSTLIFDFKSDELFVKGKITEDVFSNKGHFLIKRPYPLKTEPEFLFYSVDDLSKAVMKCKVNRNYLLFEGTLVNWSCKLRENEFLKLSTSATNEKLTNNNKDMTLLSNLFNKLTSNSNTNWDIKNLDVVNFRNGDRIPEAQSHSEWERAGIEGKPAWCYLGSSSLYGDKYGKLYNWHAVNDRRGLAPKGSHIPTLHEWKTYFKSIGGEYVAGAKMKASSGWNEINIGTNASGFAGLPGGCRASTYFVSIDDGNWWSSTEKLDEKDKASLCWLSSDLSSAAIIEYPKSYGLSVRCIRD